MIQVQVLGQGKPITLVFKFYVICYQPRKDITLCLSSCALYNSFWLEDPPPETAPDNIWNNLGQIDSLCDFGHYQTLPKMCRGKLTPFVIWNITWNISGQIDSLFDLWHYLKLFRANWLPTWFGILPELLRGKLTPLVVWNNTYNIFGQIDSLCDLEHYQILPEIYWGKIDSLCDLGHYQTLPKMCRANWLPLWFGT